VGFQVCAQEAAPTGGRMLAEIEVARAETPKPTSLFKQDESNEKSEDGTGVYPV
jgi:hypothetical protein